MEGARARLLVQVVGVRWRALLLPPMRRQMQLRMESSTQTLKTAKMMRDLLCKDTQLLANALCFTVIKLTFFKLCFQFDCAPNHRHWQAHRVRDGVLLYTCNRMRGVISTCARTLSTAIQGS